MRCFVRDISNDPVFARADVIAYMLVRLDEASKDDFEFSERVFGMSYMECIDNFLNASRFALVNAPGSNSPMYAFAKLDNGYLSTMSTWLRPKNGFALTKAIRRWAATKDGFDFLNGCYGAAELGDLKSGDVSHRWMEAIGFAYCDTAEDHGYQFARYSFQGV